MAKTIQAALSPILIVGSFCGLAIFEYPLERPRSYLTCLYFLIAGSIYVYLSYYIFSINRIALYFMLSWTNIIIIFSTTLLMFGSLFYFKKLKTCLYKLSIVDDTLEVLGTSKDYRKLYKWTIRTTIGWILLIFFVNTYDILSLDYKHFSINNICIVFIANHMFHVNALNGLIWGVILRYVSSRFSEINEHVYDLFKDDAMCTRRQNKLILINQQNTEEKRKCRQYMWIIMHVHLELCFISRELNKVFSIQMTLQMASYFAFFVEMCCQSYSIYIHKDADTFQYILDEFNFIWAIVYTAKLFTLNYICQTICDKANETVTILYKLSNDNSDKDLREQILQFILQIKRKEVKFYGMGLFYFGYDFIRTFYAAIATMLIIIMQMHVTYDDLVPYDGN
ncbi:uncharacterized protein [Anoplolepis gracilipes]|uniref:uncharacterized protein n=1 Tax=Anoplolepis gracilipes TaxID=354296 RepID=UPI003BA07C2D